MVPALCAWSKSVRSFVLLPLLLVQVGIYVATGVLSGVMVFYHKLRGNL